MKKLLISFMALAVFPLLSSARINDSKSALETRLIPKNAGALEYSQKQHRERELFKLPYYNMYLIFPRNVEAGFYFKRPDGAPTTGQDIAKLYDLYGWEINVVYKGGASVMEFYRRKGQRITLEEVAGLMTLMTKDGTKWELNYDPQKDPVFSSEGTNIYFSDFFRENFGGKPFSPTEKPAPETPEVLKNSDYADIYAMLPKSRARWVLLEVPESVRSLPEYKNTLQFEIVRRAQDAAFQAYRDKYPSSPADKKKAADSAEAKTTTNTSNPNVRNVNLGQKPLPVIDKVARIYQEIPLDNESAFGYTAKLSDDSVRMKIYNDAVLFIESNFDKEMRQELERLFSEQTKKREEETKDSLNRF